MTSGTKAIYGLDEPPRFLLVPFDVFLVFVTVLFAGALMGRAGIGCALGTVAGWGWHQVSARRGRHFGLALSYWYLGFVPVKRTPASFKRRFIG